MRNRIAIGLTVVLAACGSQPQQQAATNEPQIKVRSAEQDRLHQLDALNLAIGLKRAIQDGGFTCQQIGDAGFIATYENLDMWMARCRDGRDWAVFAGPDGSAQVRDCKDLPGTGVPECRITKRPDGSFSGS